MRSVRRDKRNYAETLAVEAEDAAFRGDTRTVYKITGELTGKGLATEHPVKDASGHLLHGDQEQLDRWRDHFISVLNHVFLRAPGEELMELPQLPTVRVRTDAPSLREIRDAVKTLPNNKAAGVDGIPAEFYKAQPGLAAEWLFPLIKACWEQEQYPQEWTEGIIVKIPKKGDPRDCNNWRGICVLPSVHKIVTKVILDRLKEHLYNTVDAAQAGFRPGSSCADHINTIRIIIEQCAAYKVDLHLLFVDFEKAFDSVRRQCLWVALRRRGVPEKFISMIKSSYDGAKCRVLHKGKLTEPFDVQSGVRQGCILSPILFLLVVGDVLEAACCPLRGCGLRWKMPSINDNLLHLDYADDICLLAEKISHVSTMVNALNTNALKVGLKINIGKTKILSLPSCSGRPVNIDGQTIEEVNSFTYSCGQNNSTFEIYFFPQYFVYSHIFLELTVE